jgi:hypothetical protein
MNSIAVLGSTSSIGKEVIKYPNTFHCPLRFEDSQEQYDKWFSANPQIDTLVHLARACKKDKIRDEQRDLSTFLLEISSIQKLLNSVPKSVKIVFASTCVIYGLSGTNLIRYTTAQAAKEIMDNNIGVVNCPFDEPADTIVDLRSLADHHKVYVMTKLAIEQMIQNHTDNHKIVRIWTTQK